MRIAIPTERAVNEQMIRRTFLGADECGAVRANTIDEKAHTAEFVIATEAPVQDRPWQVPMSLSMAGVNLQRFRKSRVVLAQHQNGVLEVVGRSLKEWVEKGDQPGQGQLCSLVEFDVGDEFSNRVWGKVQRKFVRAASAGFFVNRERCVEEGQTDQKTGFVGPVRIATAWQLYEWSVVAVGADPDALGRKGPGPEVTAGAVSRFSLAGCLRKEPVLKLKFA